MVDGDEFASIRIMLRNYVRGYSSSFASFFVFQTIDTIFIVIIDSKCQNVYFGDEGCYKQGACKCISIIHSLFAISHPFIIIIFVYSYFGVRCAMWLVSVFDLFKIPLALLILTLRACRLSPPTISTYTHNFTTCCSPPANIDSNFIVKCTEVQKPLFMPSNV